MITMHIESNDRVIIEEIALPKESQKLHKNYDIFSEKPDFTSLYAS